MKKIKTKKRSRKPKNNNVEIRRVFVRRPYSDPDDEAYIMEIPSHVYDDPRACAKAIKKFFLELDGQDPNVFPYKKEWSIKGIDPIGLFRKAFMVGYDIGDYKIDYWDDEKTMDTCMRYIYRACYSNDTIGGIYQIPHSKHDTVDFRLECVGKFFVNEGSFSNYIKACVVVCRIKEMIMYKLLGGAMTQAPGEELCGPRLLDNSDFSTKFVLYDIIRDLGDDTCTRLFKKFIGPIMRGKFTIKLRDIPWLLCRTLAVIFMSFYRDELRNRITRSKAVSRNGFDVQNGTFIRGRVKKYKPIHRVIVRIAENKVKIWTNFYKEKRMQKTIDMCLRRAKRAFPDADPRFTSLSIERVPTGWMPAIEPVCPKLPMYVCE